jgi:ABC-type transport system involved in cytochrome c biogenesis permease component
MTSLPIVARELRVAARRRGTYRMRLALASGAVITGVWIFVVTAGMSTQQSGQSIFQGLAWLCLLYCLLSGRRWTADCLSEEKREGTLGLLFLTDLKGYDVVLGKLAATSLAGFYGLLAVFPVLAIPLLLGGITNGEFWRIVLVLVNTFVFSLAVGVFGSALSRDYRPAMAANFFWLLLLIAAGPACAGAIAYFTPAHRFVPELLFGCPPYSLYLAADFAYTLHSGQFWWSVGLTHGLTWLLLLLASWIAPHSWQDQPAGTGVRRWRGFWQACSFGRAVPRQAFRRRLLAVNAFYWLAARARLKPMQVWVFLGLMAGWWLVGLIFAGSAWHDESVAITTALLLNTTLKFWLVIEAGQRLSDDQTSGAMELLLSTPLSVRDILRGQMLALRRQFLRPLLVVIAIEIGFMCQVHAGSLDPKVFPVWTDGMLILVADLLALGWVAMACALTAKNQNQATLRAIWRILILPWLVGAAVVMIGQGWAGLVLDKVWVPGWRFYLRLWFWLGLGADLGFGLWAWWLLRTRFRQLALQRYDPKPERSHGWLGRSKATTAHSATPDAPGRELEAERQHKRPSALKKAAVFGGAALMLVALGLAFHWHRSQPSFPAPVIVSLQRTNAPFRVAPGPGGVFLILPDGSLWHWGQLAGPAPPLGKAPVQVGLNSDWVQAVGSQSLCVGLRSDGTLWEWGRHGHGVSDPPRQVDTGHDWISVAATPREAVALRQDGTLWAWGEKSGAQSGYGLDLSWTNLVQVGSDYDWAAVACHRLASLGVRRDGSLWVWGMVFAFGNNRTARDTYPTPTLVCRETNWVGFTTGFQPVLARTRSGELWEPLISLPSAEAPASLICRLVASNAVPDHMAMAYCRTAQLYQVRPDGTLWTSDSDRPAQFSTFLAAKWRQVGNRSDWVSVRGVGGTAFGLTADGTLWTWGIDPTRPPVLEFGARFKVVQQRIAAYFAKRPAVLQPPRMPACQNEPRPLMQLQNGQSRSH